MWAVTSPPLWRALRLSMNQSGFKGVVRERCNCNRPGRCFNRINPGCEKSTMLVLCFRAKIKARILNADFQGRKAFPT